jgi:hypothetical protein
VSALLEVLEPPDVLMVVAAARVMPVLDAPIVVEPLLVIKPARYTVLGAVAVKPVLNVKASVDRLPNFNVPVLLNVAALVMLVLDPANARL